MQPNRISYLLEKYKRNELTPGEWEELAAATKEGETLESLIQQDLQARWGTPDAVPDTIMNEALTRVLAVDTLPQPARTINFRRYWIAAAIVLGLGVGVYRWLSHPPASKPATLALNKAIQPGKNGAILTLADGTHISLDSLQNGVVALQGGATARVVNGSLVYEGSGTAVMYNTMTTPKGRQFNLTLPDGSKVWLNAASSIRYPLAFNGNERKVEITGEAYFEVAQNATKPFRINADNRQEIQVLGTHFNVNAYGNEKTLNTTLLEGSVSVTSGLSSVKLKPGQQAAGQASGIKVINDVDLEKVMSWKNGLFNFENVRLEDVMRQLERWYDIEVVYEKNIPDVELVGKMTRGVTLNELVDVLKELGVHCRLEGRKLIVQP